MCVRIARTSACLFSALRFLRQLWGKVIHRGSSGLCFTPEFLHLPSKLPRQRLHTQTFQFQNGGSAKLSQIGHPEHAQRDGKKQEVRKILGLPAPRVRLQFVRYPFDTSSWYQRTSVKLRKQSFTLCFNCWMLTSCLCDTARRQSPPFLELRPPIAAHARLPLHRKHRSDITGAAPASSLGPQPRPPAQTPSPGFQPRPPAQAPSPGLQPRPPAPASSHLSAFAKRASALAWAVHDPVSLLDRQSCIMLTLSNSIPILSHISNVMSTHEITRDLWNRTNSLLS